MTARRIEVIGLAGMPSVQPGDDLAHLVSAALAGNDVTLAAGDVVVVAQKIVSKAEGRYVDLASVVPTVRAVELAREAGKDPRIVEVILGESTRVVRHARGVLIVEHRLGFVMANAGVDQSNLPSPGGEGGADAGERVLLLPRDPDDSARRLRAALTAAHGVDVGVLITDSFGRPWRRGSTGVAVGAAGLPVVVDLRGRPDLFGRTLQVTMVALADQVAAAAVLAMGEADEGVPAAVVRGLRWTPVEEGARSVVRPPVEDLFR